ncbi:MAG: LTA synthase family protein [Clostridia bacterium]|nr:LTA synthase family protein [Clostridia bacterium]
MLWICVILISAIISIADIYLFTEDKRPATCIHAIIRDTVTVNLLSFFITRNIFGLENIFTPSVHDNWYPVKYTALSLTIGVAFLCVIGFINRNLKLEYVEPKSKKGTLAIKVVSLVLFALGVAAFTGTIWGKEAFGDLEPDQILINLNSPTEGTDIGVYISLFEGPVLTTALLTTIFCIVVFSKRKLIFEKNDKIYSVLPDFVIRILCVVLSIVIFIGGCAFGINKFQLTTLISAYFADSPYIEENYVDPNSANLKFPEEKRNLIHIYLESMENTFFSKELGGYFDENLMPDLTELCKEGYSFSNLESGFGGPPTSTGGNWSVASMVNMSTGLPMKVPVDRNAYGAKDNFLPGAVTLGDILHEQGYEQSVMFGADAAFGGLDFFFESHGDFEILDHKAAKELGWLPEDYKVFWGYEDDKLYEFAKKELTRLGESGKPFHFVMETADTHAPDGYLSEKAEKKFDSQYANCIYYSQAEAVKFVRWIQEQDFYENTTIVLIGDHLSMARDFCTPINNDGYYRTCFNLFINPPEELCNIDKSRLYNRDWAVFDMFPTLVACLGIEFDGERLGIGTNLFSDEQTLFERDGVSFVNKELENRSNFYNNNILVDWNLAGKS